MGRCNSSVCASRVSEARSGALDLRDRAESSVVGFLCCGSRAHCPRAWLAVARARRRRWRAVRRASGRYRAGRFREACPAFCSMAAASCTRPRLSRCRSSLRRSSSPTPGGFSPVICAMRASSQSDCGLKASACGPRACWTRPGCRRARTRRLCGGLCRWRCAAGRARARAPSGGCAGTRQAGVGVLDGRGRVVLRAAHGENSAGFGAGGSLDGHHGAGRDAGLLLDRPLQGLRGEC